MGVFVLIFAPIVYSSVVGLAFFVLFHLITVGMRLFGFGSYNYIEWIVVGLGLPFSFLHLCYCFRVILPLFLIAQKEAGPNGWGGNLSLGDGWRLFQKRNALFWEDMGLGAVHAASDTDEKE